jgi:hypothetical protein
LDESPLRRELKNPDPADVFCCPRLELYPAKEPVWFIVELRVGFCPPNSDPQKLMEFSCATLPDAQVFGYILRREDCEINS